MSHWEDRRKGTHSPLGESVSGALPPSVQPRWEGSPPSQSELARICLLPPFGVRLHWGRNRRGLLKEGRHIYRELIGLNGRSFGSVSTCSRSILTVPSLHEALGVQRWQYWNSGECFTYKQMKWSPTDLLQRAEIGRRPSRGRTRQGACAVPAQHWRKQSFRTCGFVTSGESSSQPWEQAC